MPEMKMPANEAQRLATLYHLNILDTPAEERFDRITRIAAQLFDAPIALISLVDADRQWFKSRQGLSISQTPRSDSFCGYAICGDDIFIVPDTQADSRFISNPLVTDEPYVRFYAGQPLSGPDGSKIGTLCLMDIRPRQFSETDRQALNDLAIWAENELNSIEFSHEPNGHKQTEEIPEQQQTILGNVINTIPHFIFARDREGRFTLVNQAIAEAYNTTTEEMMGKTDGDFLPNQQYAEQIHRDDLAVMSTLEEQFIQEEKIIDVNGRVRWLQKIKRPLVNQDGNVDQVLGIAIDITQRKQVEAERAHFINQLHTAADVSRQLTAILDPDQLLSEIVTLLQARFDLYHVHIYLLDETTNSLVMQAGSGKVGKTMREQGHQIPLNYKHSLVARAARSRELVAVEDVSQESDFMPHPLLPHTRCEIAVPLVIGGKLLGVLDVQENEAACFIPSDLDVFNALAGQIAIALENAHLFEESQQTAQRLREVDRLKSEFLANMSHELRTPLNSITGYAEMILMDMSGDLDSDARKDVQAIYDNGQQLIRLVNDILDLAKIEAGRLTLHPEEISIGGLLKDIRINNIGLLVNKSLELVTEIEEDLPWIQADYVRLNQILNNLVSNAIKFTYEGGINLRAYSENEWLCIEVEDTGIGISQVDLETIFEKFRQVDGSFTRRAEGTGLGLAITRHLVEMHRGQIEVDSELGRGTKITVRLPIEPPSEAETDNLYSLVTEKISL